jgi:hypothetical protein
MKRTMMLAAGVLVAGAAVVHERRVIRGDLLPRHELAAQRRAAPRHRGTMKSRHLPFLR